MEQINSGLENKNKRLNSLVLASHSEEEMEIMEYTGTGNVQSIYMHSTESHIDVGSHQKEGNSNVHAVPVNYSSENFVQQDESALDLLASMSVGNRPSNTIAEAATSDRHGQFHNIRMEWFVEFTWLEFEEISVKLYCRYCKYFDPCGIFSVGKIAAHTKYEDIRKHGSSEQHRRSLQKHLEQFPDTVQNIQLENSVNNIIENEETLSKVTPHHWSILFPWLHHNRATDTLYCQPCQQDGMSGTLVSGVDRVNISMSEIEEHEQLVSHRTAVVQHKRRHLATMGTSTMSILSAEKDSLGIKKIKRKKGRHNKSFNRYILYIIDVKKLI